MENCNGENDLNVFVLKEWFNGFHSPPHSLTSFIAYEKFQCILVFRTSGITVCLKLIVELIFDSGRERRPIKCYMKIDIVCCALLLKIACRMNRRLVCAMNHAIHFIQCDFQFTFHEMLFIQRNERVLQGFI